MVQGMVLDGAGGGTPIDWAGVRDWRAERGTLWAHLDRTSEGVPAWVASQFEHESVAEGLLAENTRPRVELVGERLVFNLRGVNLNPGAEPEDMLVIRGWAEPRRVVTLAKYRLLTVEGVLSELGAGRGPESTGDLLTWIAYGLTERMVPVLADIEESLSDLEERVIDPERILERSELVEVRQMVISLRRFLAPQARALVTLADIPFAPLQPDHRRAIRDTANDVTRMVEDLEAARSRAAVVQDELSNRLAERINLRMYALTIIAAIFLPLTLISGMFGMNVGGVPFLEHGVGFWLVTGGMLLLGVVGVWIARLKDWL